MSEYTPTTGEIRSEFALFAGSVRDYRTWAFDRWLAAHDAEVAAKALEAFAEKWATSDGIEALMFAQDDVAAVQLAEKALLTAAAEYRNPEGNDHG